MQIDLHMHTTASDGQYTPAQILTMAHALSLDIIAITDHDTVAGARAAMMLATQMAQTETYPQIIPAIEISAEDDGSVDMLGYFIDIDSPELTAVLDDFRQDRFSRGQRILERLSSLGLPLDWSRVLEIAATDPKRRAQNREESETDAAGSVGRPHIARAMIERGYVESVREAFERYLYDEGPAYVARKRLSPEESISMIHRAGGAAVLAHPALLRAPIRMTERLIGAGLDGIEVYHPKNPDDFRLTLRGLAEKHNLVITGGSDFHGERVSEPRLGQEFPPAESVEALRARAASHRIPSTS